jgi:hypothetical protein
LFSDCGIEVTYIGIDGAGYDGKLKPWGGRAHKKLLISEFASAVLLSLVSNPAGSDSPAFDHFATCSLSYLDSTKECLAFVSINDSLLPFQSATYDRLMHQLVKMYPWKFGFGFRAPVASKPDFHILGANDGNLSPEAYQALCAWYHSSPEVRVTRLRDLYPDNIVNTTQLTQRVGSVSLRQVAERHGSLTPLEQSGLFLWRLEESELSRVRAELAGSDVLIASSDR